MRRLLAASLLLPFLVLGVGATTYSQTYITTEGTQVTLGADMKQTQIPGGTPWTFLVFFTLNQLRSAADDVHDVTIRLSISGNGFYTEGEISFLDRSSDSLKVAGDRVVGEIRLDLVDIDLGTYDLSIQADFREDVPLASDPTYRTGWLFLTQIEIINILTSETSFPSTPDVEVSTTSYTASNFVPITLIIILFSGLVAVVMFVSSREGGRDKATRTSGGVVMSSGGKTIQIGGISSEQYKKPEEPKQKVVTRTCTTCGSALSDIDVFCAFCGTKVS